MLFAVLALQAGAALYWLLVRWTASPLQALLGAACVFAIGPLGLAAEFVMLRMVARSDRGVPRASGADLVRAWWGEVREQFRVFCWRLPMRWRQLPDDLGPEAAGRCGVVFIHGFVCNRGLWAPWLRLLHARGIPFTAVNLEPVFGPIEDYAPIVEDAVRRVTFATGRPPVLVCHSMGGLVARTWLRSARAGARVAHVVTIGSPHHGTWLARFSRTGNGRQMQLQSEWLKELERDEQRAPAPPFTCWYSNCDNVVFPPSTATLAGAQNRFLPGIAHVALAFRPEVMQATLVTITSACPGE
jgi:triacylglycerol lipase